MTASADVNLNTQLLKLASWWEILVMMYFSLGITLVSPSLKLIGIFIPVAYLIIERHLRGRTWSEISFNLRSIYRALFQNRISAFLSPAVAILLTSLVFALMHFSPGPALIVSFDLFSVFIDSTIFGIIFFRSHNVFVAWIAHFLADIAGVFYFC